MKNHSILATLLGALAASPASARPNDELLRARVAAPVCNHDNCYRGGAKVTTLGADCSSYLDATVTPCASTTTTTTTATSTVTVDTWPLNERDMVAARAPAGLVQRQAPTTCAATTAQATAIPSWATAACTADPTPPAARFSSVCSCNGFFGTTSTAPTPTVTVTATTTTTATATATPSLFILQDSGYQEYYISIGNGGAVAITTNPADASPFYVDNDGQWRSPQNPDWYFVDTYVPDSATANDQVFIETPSAGNNYNITCNSIGHNAGDFWGDCQSSGSADGNPVVYGFGLCPNDTTDLYMIPNDSNVHCWDGGYAFLGFYLIAYNPSGNY